MSTFKVDDFIEDLKDTIKENDTVDVWDLVHEEIDNACIYYTDCFAIVTELNMTDWKDNEFGDVTNIQQLAYIALYDYVVDNLEVPA